MSLLVCTPMYGGLCMSGYFRSSLELRGYLLGEGVAHDWLVMTNESAIHRARNECVRTFLEETDYDRLLFIDGDIEYSCEDVGRLWAMDCDVAVGVYPMKRLGAPYAAWVDGKLVEELGGGVVEVDYAGTGFMMIKRGVLRDLVEGSVEYEGPHGRCWQLFDWPIVDGVELSEDYSFCLKAREAGYVVKMDTGIRLVHWGQHGYGG